MGHRRHPQDLTAKHPKEAESLGHRHHIFTVELFLDETGEATDIFVDHSQSGEKEKLTSWEPEKLVRFIARHTGLQATQLTPKEHAGPLRRASGTTTTKSLRELSPTSGRVLPSTASAEPGGTPHVRELKVVSVDSDDPNYVLRQGQPFMVRLTLDLTEVIASKKMPLTCEATIIARQPGGPDRTVGAAHRRIEASKSTTISVASSGLPQGMYHLDALVRLVPAGLEHGRQAGTVAYLEGDLLEVY